MLQRDAARTRPGLGRRHPIPANSFFSDTLVGATGKFMLQQMAAIAELEAGMISARTKAALQAAKKRGVVLGGYRDHDITAKERRAGLVIRQERELEWEARRKQGMTPKNPSKRGVYLSAQPRPCV
jgi:DNA invertase Pin-like site-specific DNA recombinase